MQTWSHHSSFRQWLCPLAAAQGMSRSSVTFSTDPHIDVKSTRTEIMGDGATILMTTMSVRNPCKNVSDRTVGCTRSENHFNLSSLLVLKHIFHWKSFDIQKGSIFFFCIMFHYNIIINVSYWYWSEYDTSFLRNAPTPTECPLCGCVWGQFREQASDKVMKSKISFFFFPIQEPNKKKKFTSEILVGQLWINLVQ